MVSRSNLIKKAKELRLNGKSYREIATELQVSVSSAHSWSNDVKLTTEQIAFLTARRIQAFQKGRKIGSKARRTSRNSHEEQVIVDAKKEFRSLQTDSFFITGLSLYWAEGFKKDHSLGFVNSDPIMSKLFLDWLTKYGNVHSENIRTRVQINEIYRSTYPEIENYWSRILHVPTAQFQKPFFQSSKRTNIVDSSYKGQIRIRAIGSRDFFVKILAWIQELKLRYSSKV